MEFDRDDSEIDCPRIVNSECVHCAKVDGESIRIYDEETDALKQYNPGHLTLGDTYYIVATSSYRIITVKRVIREPNGDLGLLDEMWTEKSLDTRVELLGEDEFRKYYRIPGEDPGVLMECSNDPPRKIVRLMQYQIVQTGKWITPKPTD